MSALGLAACLHQRWSSEPATKAPTNAISLDEGALFATAPLTDAATDAPIYDACASRTVRIVAAQSCATACKSIDVLLGGARMGSLLASPAAARAKALPEWADLPTRPEDGGRDSWTRALVVPVDATATLSLSAGCRARFAGGATSIEVSPACGERRVEIACDE